ncbi:MAG: aldo/keto reductase [Psychrobacter sp.]|jgi:aryl-alcohol dehydrogenase-like predicted oxidoreductase|nr:aldo/keto reductase [Psychrobacter sp.]
MQTGLAKRKLGRTGLEVTQLGFGGVEIGDLTRDISDEAAGRVLHVVLDSGINFIDTAPDYGLSEERIGKHISHRRNEYYLATKCGCNIAPDGERQNPGHVWTGERLRRNIDQSLRRMRTDYIDVLQMHNPSVEEFEQGGLGEVLQEIRQAGKTRFIGVSSTAPHLLAFARMGAFDTFQIPYSALERRHERMIKQAADMGAGIIIRGGIAQGHRDSRGRWAKWEKAQLDDLLDDMNRYEFVLRFTLTHPACHTTIVGTADLNHLRANVATIKAGPLPPDVYELAKGRLTQIGEAPEG